MFRTFAAMAVFAVTTFSYAESTLRAAVDRAAERDPDTRTFTARIAEGRAREHASRSLTPGAPALWIGSRRDNTLLDRQLGKSEYEAEIEIPLWLPGQRAAARASAAAQEETFRMNAELARWIVAGAVRDQVWATALDRADVAVSRRRLEVATSIEGDVAKRLKAGDVARGDLLQAQSETLSARSVLADAELRYRRSLAHWTALTGFDELPARYEEGVQIAIPLERHPRLAARRAAVAAARAEVDAVDKFSRDAPTLSLQNRTDRDITGGDVRNTVRINVRIPFATEARNLPRTSAAQAVLTQALTLEQRERVLLAADVETARLTLETAVAQHEIARERDAHSREALRLARRGFTQGETPYMAVLLALARSVDAETAFARSDISVKLSRARFNQARGNLP